MVTASANTVSGCIKKNGAKVEFTMLGYYCCTLKKSTSTLSEYIVIIKTSIWAWKPSSTSEMRSRKCHFRTQYTYLRYFLLHCIPVELSGWIDWNAPPRIIVSCVISSELVAKFIKCIFWNIPFHFYMLSFTTKKFNKKSRIPWILRRERRYWICNDIHYRNTFLFNLVAIKQTGF